MSEWVELQGSPHPGIMCPDTDFFFYALVHDGEICDLIGMMAREPPSTKPYHDDSTDREMYLKRAREKFENLDSLAGLTKKNCWDDDLELQ